MIYEDFIAELKKFKLSEEEEFSRIFNNQKEKDAWVERFQKVNDTVDNIISYVDGLRMEDEAIVNRKVRSGRKWHEDLSDY